MSKMVKYYKGDLVEYDIFKLVDFYDPILRQPTIPMNFNTNEELKRANYLAFSLAETLSELEGLGLSSNQIGLRERVCAINMGSEFWVMFNPEIIEQSSVPSEYFEGCLSYPGLYLKLKRPNHIKVRFQATNGEILEKEFDGLTAVCVQHEIDHLNGIMYTDKVSSIKLEQAKRKVKSNIKKMKKWQIEQEQNNFAENSSVQTQIQSEQPTIQILDPASDPLTIEKKPEKFVYSAG